MNSVISQFHDVNVALHSSWYLNNQRCDTVTQHYVSRFTQRLTINGTIEFLLRSLYCTIYNLIRVETQTLT